MIAALVSSRTIDHLLAAYGYGAVFVFVAVESLGVPFPGETMLIAAALYAGATHNLTIAWVVVAAAAGAIVGDNVGFGLGWWGGFQLLRRYGRRIRLDEGKLKLGRYLFARHGGKVVFFGRWVSILRTYAAFLAGTNRMRWPRFLAFNAAGGILWAAVYGIAFYELGSAITRLRTPIDVALAVAAGIAILAFAVWARRNARRLEQAAERAFPGPLDGRPGESK